MKHQRCRHRKEKKKRELKWKKETERLRRRWRRIENEVVILHYVSSGPTERMTCLDTRWKVQSLQRDPEQPQPAKRQGRADPRPAAEQPLNNSAHHDATITSAQPERESKRESVLHMPLKRLLDWCRVVCDAGNGQMVVQASQWFHFMWRCIFTQDGEKTVFLQS